MAEQKLLWWQKEIIYQVYPRSFKDSNGDGVGDLPGIIEKLDYLQWLGIRAVWVSPVYPSPMADFGYDVSDYTGIHPLFGTLEDFDRLLEQAHRRNIRIIMDLVPNHSSDQHPWFLESRSSRDNPRRDWCLWKDPAPGGAPPNNWISEFGGSAWEFDKKTGQYYYHSFLKEQPDLNWRNPRVREAIWEVMRYWFDRGVDGFRVDVLWYLIKDEHLRDNPVNPDWEQGMPEHDKLIPAFSCDQPFIYEIIEEMRRLSDEYEDRVLIGEIYLPFEKLVLYYGEGKGVHLPFNFHLIQTNWDAAEINALVSSYEGAIQEGQWPNWVLGNHDRPRLKTRIGKEQVWNAALLLLSLRGTPTLYYGDEIGMEDGNIPEDKIQDPRELLEPGIGLGRDPERTPMQWDDTEYAGFSETEPWLPVGDNLDEINVRTQKANERSLLHFYRKLIRLRQREPALYGGDYFPAGIKDQLLCYTRKQGEDEFMIALNLGGQKTTFRPNFRFSGTVVLARNKNKEGEEVKDELSLEGHEGLIIRLRRKK